MKISRNSPFIYMKTQFKYLDETLRESLQIITR